MTRPLGFVAVRDQKKRSTIIKGLWRMGWTVIEYASGFHVVQALSHVILDGITGPSPDLIVMDERSHGYSGKSIVAGFRDLGVQIPIILVGVSHE